MPNPLFPLQLRPQTALAPNRRGTLIIPNRKGAGQEVPDVLTGLVTQADVNTNGRTDNLPYDNILDAVGAPSGTPGLGAPGEGGYAGMDFNGIDEAVLMDASANGFLNGGDYTYACRAAGTAIVESGLYAFSGGQGQASLHLPQSAGGNTRAFIRNDIAQGITADGIGAVNDGVEHVIVARFTDAGNVLDLWIDGVPNNTGTGAYGPPSTATAHTWGAFVDPTPFLPFLGEIFWTAAWGRALTDEQMAYLFAVPNPFGRLPSVVPDIISNLTTQIDVNTVGRTDDAPFDNITGNLAQLIGTVPPTVGPAGEGGYVPIVFDGVDQYARPANTADNEVPEGEPVPPGESNEFLNGEAWTMAVRAKTSVALEQGVYSFGSEIPAQGQASLKLPWDAGGGVEIFARADSVLQTLNRQGAGFADGLEHVIVARRLGTTTDIFVDGVNLGQVTGNYTGDTTTQNHIWAAFFDGSAVPFLFFAGSIYWSASWDRNLSTEQIEFLSSSANPFAGQLPPPPPPVGGTGPGGSVYAESFEAGMDWDFFYGPSTSKSHPAPDASTDFGNGGLRSMKAHLIRDSFEGGQFRTEITMSRYNNLNQFAHMLYSIDILIPTSYVDPETWQSVWQWHDTPNDWDNGRQNPPFMLELKNDPGNGNAKSWHMYNLWSLDPVPPGGPVPPLDGSRDIYVGPIAPDLGRWVRWELDIVWNYTDPGPGTFTMRKDGIIVWSAAGPNCYNEEPGGKGPYAKAGIYMGWRDSDGPKPTNEMIVYYDNIRTEVSP